MVTVILDLYDTDDNQKDCRAVNWKTCDVTLYKPRCIKDGKWDIYFNKAKLKETIPLKKQRLKTQILATESCGQQILSQYTIIMQQACLL